MWLNPVEEAQFQYANSRILTDTLRNAIMENGHSSSEIESHDEARLFIRNLNNDRKKTRMCIHNFQLHARDETGTRAITAQRDRQHG